MTETRRKNVLARALISVMLCLIAAQLHAQGAVPKDAGPRVAWLAKHAVRIRSLDAADDDFEDLEPLRATLKGVRVGMLGEQSHGDGTTAAHSRLAATQPWSGSFWRQFLTSLRVFAEQTWRTDYADHAGNAAVFAMRDQQMGKNLSG